MEPTTPDLAGRVLRSGALLVGALGAGAWWLGGASAAAGVTGGGVVALVNFGWLAREVAGAAQAVAGAAQTVAAEAQTVAGASRRALGRLGLRQVATLGALGLLVGLGWGHPVGVAVGLASLPPILLVEGLRAARQPG